jgi:predicted RecA/RadA family phage recombinase
VVVVVVGKETAIHVKAGQAGQGVRRGKMELPQVGRVDWAEAALHEMEQQGVIEEGGMERVVVAAVAALRGEGQEVEQPPATAAAEAAAEAIALCQQEVLSLAGISLLLAAIPILITCRVSVLVALERHLRAT